MTLTTCQGSTLGAKLQQANLAHPASRCRRSIDLCWAALDVAPAAGLHQRVIEERRRVILVRNDS
jgi:hypothetical protein